MKKLFAALASAALVGTVFAQTAAPSPATQPQGAMAKDQVEVVKGKGSMEEKADMDKTNVSPQADEAKAKPGAGKEKTEIKANAKANAKANTKGNSHHSASKTKGTAHSKLDSAKPEGKVESDQANMTKATPQSETPVAAADTDNKKQ